jgi:hypothetical protein
MEGIIERTPSFAERNLLLEKLMSREIPSGSGLSDTAVDFLWSTHCFPEKGMSESFVSKRSNRVNRYSFDMEHLPNRAFWELWDAFVNS